MIIKQNGNAIKFSNRHKNSNDRNWEAQSRKGRGGRPVAHLSKCEVKDYGLLINLEMKGYIFEVTKLSQEETKTKKK